MVEYYALICVMVDNSQCFCGAYPDFGSAVQAVQDFWKDDPSEEVEKYIIEGWYNKPIATPNYNGAWEISPDGGDVKNVNSLGK